MMHLLSQIQKLRAHACRWAALPEVTVPSAAVTDDDTQAWSADSYAQDLANQPAPRYQPAPRTGETS